MTDEISGLFQLLDSIQAMAKDDLAIVPFITHKLPIVLKISDRVTVLRRGKVVSTIDTENATERSLAIEMVGREVIFRIEKTKVEKGKTILEVEDLSAISDKGLLALNGVSFSIREGEIFGIAGIAGNGQQELLAALSGEQPLDAHQDYEIHIDGESVGEQASGLVWFAKEEEGFSGRDNHKFQ